jgi:hypothetical protein
VTEGRRSTKGARATTRVALGAAVLAAAGAAICMACGTETSGSGPNGPCTRTKDCVDGLECLNGVCFAADAGLGPDAGSALDSSEADAAASD